MYIRPFISDIVRLGLNIEAIDIYSIFLRYKNDIFITIHNGDGWTSGVSIEYPSRDNVTLATDDNQEVIDFIKKHLKL